MKHTTLVILLALAPLSWGEDDNPILGDLVDIPNLSPEAQFCQIGKPKNGRFTGLEKCKKGDVLFYGDVVKTKNVDHMIRVCEWNTFQQPQTSVVKIGAYAETYATCIYRGSEMLIRK